MNTDPQPCLHGGVYNFVVKNGTNMAYSSKIFRSMFLLLVVEGLALAVYVYSMLTIESNKVHWCETAHTMRKNVTGSEKVLI
jgi:hypothetical protein